MQHLSNINGVFVFQINNSVNNHGEDNNPITGRENLIELELNRATNVSIENNTATIIYDNGIVNVSGNDLQFYRNDNWDYGEGIFGTKYLLYTTCTSLTFNISPNEDYSAFCWVNGNNQNIVHTIQILRSFFGQNLVQTNEFQYDRI